MGSKLIHQIIDLFATNRNLIDVAKTFIVRVLAAVLAFGVQVFLAQSLAIDEYGIYVLIWTWLMVINLFAVFGFSESSLRFIPRYVLRKQHHWARGFIKTGFLFSILGATLVGFLGLIIIWFFYDTIPPSYSVPLIILGLALPIMAQELYLEGISRAFGWYMLTTVPGYIVRPLFIAVGVFGVMQFGFVPNAATVLALVVITTAGIVIFQAFVIRARIKKQFGDIKTSKIKKFWVTSSLPLVFIAGIDELYLWSDIIILGFLMSAPDVAIYFAAQRSMSIASFIQYAFMMVSAREFSLANAMRNKSELQRRISSTSSWTFWLTVPAVLIMLLVGYPLLSMFGSQFVSGYSVMLVLGVGFIVRASVGQATDLLVVMGHQNANLWVSLGGIIFNIIFSLLLVPNFGIAGVAMATTITFVLRSIAMTIIVKKLTGLWVLTSITPPLKKMA